MDARSKPDEYTQLSEDQVRSIRERLTRPVGRYDVERASQLSGIPERTIHHWASAGVMRPDYGGQPLSWSYRDLVLLRLVAWLRNKDMRTQWVAQRVEAVRSWLEDPTSDIRVFRSQGQSMVIGDEALDRVSGELLIPQVVEFISPWKLFESLPGSLRRTYVGPDLIKPASRVTIIPWVMGGEPCIEGTRIPTSTLYALHEQRSLSAVKIAHLYPTVPREAIVQAIELEDRLHKRAA